MSKLSVRDLLAKASTDSASSKTWGGHNRADTVGASEVGQCIRRVAFDKLGVPRDAEYVEKRGAMDRGNLIERHYWEPGIRAALAGSSIELIYAGDQQRTLVDGYLSATPDGLLVGVDRDCLAHLGVPDIGSSGELLVEAKSIDPRVDLEQEKAEHQFQVRQQLGLMRKCTNHKPEYALITYINASWLDQVDEFAVKYDDRVFDAGRQRALKIMSCGDPNELTAEGKAAGGKECGHCPWRGQCAASVYDAVPRVENKLSEPDMIRCSEMVFAERKLAALRDETDDQHRAMAEELKAFLRDRQTRRVVGETFSVSYSPIAGRTSLDIEAMKNDGIDLDPYQKLGDPGERLTVKLK